MCGSESPEGGGGLEGSVGGVRSERDGQHQRRVTHAVVCVVHLACFEFMFTSSCFCSRLVICWIVIHPRAIPRNRTNGSGDQNPMLKSSVARLLLFFCMTQILCPSTN